MTGAPLQSERTSTSEDARRQLLGRIVASRSFAKSTRLREFLQFITEKCLEGDTQAVTELEIARRIFGRGEDFVPADDSVVRVSARQLRVKLKEYFDGEGRLEPLIVNIPKGAYLPVFEDRDGGQRAAHPEEPAPARTTWRSLDGKWRVGIAAIVTVNMVLLAANFWWMRRSTVAPPEPSASLLTFFLSRAKTPVHVVVSDFSLPLMRFGSDDHGAYTLNEYLDWDYSRLRPDARDGARMGGLFEILRTHRITRLGDLIVALRIQRAADGQVPILVRHARDVSLRDFKTGSHIVLGNPYSTPWMSLFEDRLNFYNIRAPREGVGFANRKPLPGEAPVFRVQHAEREEGSGYARVAFVSNTSGSEGVLLISGVNMVTMEAAGEFVSDPASVPRILQSLRVRSLDQIPYFELLLETQAVDNTPQKARILASRILSGAR